MTCVPSTGKGTTVMMGWQIVITGVNGGATEGKGLDNVYH